MRNSPVGGDRPIQNSERQIFLVLVLPDRDSWLLCRRWTIIALRHLIVRLRVNGTLWSGNSSGVDLLGQPSSFLEAYGHHRQRVEST